MRVFESRTVTGNELFSILTFPSHNHIHIAKYFFFSVRDEKYKNLGDNTVLARNALFWLLSASQKRVRVSKTRVLKLSVFGRRLYFNRVSATF